MFSLVISVVCALVFVVLLYIFFLFTFVFIILHHLNFAMYFFLHHGPEGTTFQFNVYLYIVEWQ